jgi:hypothetical protein
MNRNHPLVKKYNKHLRAELKHLFNPRRGLYTQAVRARARVARLIEQELLKEREAKYRYQIKRVRAGFYAGWYLIWDQLKDKPRDPDHHYDKQAAQVAADRLNRRRPR